MDAIVIEEFGPPSVLKPQQMPDPVPGPGEVLIRVEFASITFVETQVRNGTPPHPSMLPELPAVLGNGVGGRVDSTGTGTDPALEGRTVITTTGGSGGYADLVAVPATGLIDIPDGVDLRDAIALLADGRTALSQFEAASVGAGDLVLVNAAGGGVGSLLVQLARNAGATVIGAAGSQSKLELAASLGAGHTVDYRRPDWAESIADQVGMVDVAFDGVGGRIGRDAFDLVKPGGRFCGFGMASGEFARISEDEATLRQVAKVSGGRLEPDQMIDLTRSALTEAAAGRLKPVIGAVFPLKDAADAHAAIEAREVIGKTLLVVESDL